MRRLTDFEFLATVLVRGRGGNANRASISDGPGLWLRLEVIAGVIAGATSIGDRGGFWAAKEGIIEFSEEELTF